MKYNIKIKSVVYIFVKHFVLSMDDSNNSTQICYAIPTEEPHITLDDIKDEKNELIFVQHSETIPTKMILQALQDKFNNKSNKSVKIEEHEGNSEVYPLGIENGSLFLVRPVDHYFVALQNE